MKYDELAKLLDITDMTAKKYVDYLRQDFLVQLLQVAYDIDNEKNFKRETSALVNASISLRCDHLTLIAFSPTRDVEVSGKSIHIVSAIEWLTDVALS